MRLGSAEIPDVFTVDFSKGIYLLSLPLEPTFQYMQQVWSSSPLSEGKQNTTTVAKDISECRAAYCSCTETYGFIIIIKTDRDRGGADRGQRTVGVFTEGPGGPSGPMLSCVHVQEWGREGHLASSLWKGRYTRWSDQKRNKDAQTHCRGVFLKVHFTSIGNQDSSGRRENAVQWMHPGKLAVYDVEKV